MTSKAVVIVCYTDNLKFSSILINFYASSFRCCLINLVPREFIFRIWSRSTVPFEWEGTCLISLFHSRQHNHCRRSFLGTRTCAFRWWWKKLSVPFEAIAVLIDIIWGHSWVARDSLRWGLVRLFLNWGCSLPLFTPNGWCFIRALPLEIVYLRDVYIVSDSRYWHHMKEVLWDGIGKCLADSRLLLHRLFINENCSIIQLSTRIVY
jgi:hypothetical protein